MNVRKIAMMIGMGTAGLCLVGAGAGATFTDSTHSNQTITAGSMNMQLSAPGGTVSSDGKTVTLPATGPTNSTFKTDATPFEITNAGNIPVNEVFIKGSEAPGATSADQALFNQTSICVYSPAIDSNNPGGVVFNGPLSQFVSSGQGVYGPLAKGAKDHYTAEYYAGKVTTACGDVNTPSLTDAAQGGTITPQVDLSYEG
ncbi:MAG TPA: hypothetical protein VIG48_03435 [Jatrophihabitans sp.]|jgi:predicted ribosomally synthesized peptide with SipW-like signal peptide